MTGYRLMSLMPSMMRSFSSCFDAIRMWRKTERANLEKKPSTRLVEPGAVFWREGEREAARGLSSEPGVGFSGDMRRVVVQDHLGRRARVSDIEKFEEFDELAAAGAVFDQGVDLPGEQIDPGQQAERAVAPVLMIARECRVSASTGGKSGDVVAVGWIPGFSS
jgi:hypothetical protein